MQTHSPSSMLKDTSRSTSRAPFRVRKDFETFLTSRNFMPSRERCTGPPFGQQHQAVQEEADEADCENRKNDVLVNERVIFLPQETTDTGRPREHFGGDDDQPRDA